MPPSKGLQRPRGLSRRLARMPLLLFRAHLGWLLGDRFLMLTHTGRVSGRLRQTVLEVVRHDRPTDTYFIASGWGTKSDWYRNIRKNPKVLVQVGRRRLEATAEQLAPEAAEQELREYAQRHPAAARSLARILGYEIEDPEQDFAALHHHLPIIALRPRRSHDES